MHYTTRVPFASHLCSPACAEAPTSRAKKLRVTILAGVALSLISLLLPAGAMAQNIINTVAGGAVPSGAATSLDLPGPAALTRDASGNVYIAVPNLFYVLKVDTTGSASIFAGVGVKGFQGDGGPANQAVLSSPSALAIDSAGNIYIGDLNRVREVTTDGIINTIAGTGIVCNPSNAPCGDGGPATSALLDSPQGLAVDGVGNVYIADTQDQRIRLITKSTGIITTVAGTGKICDGPTEPCGDKGQAINALFDMPTGILLDGSGNIIVSDTRDQRIRIINASTKVITTLAGTGQYCSNTTSLCGDGGPPANARLFNPSGMSMDAAGNIYFADQLDNRVRVITAGPNSIVATLAGTGNQGYSGDAGKAKSANLDQPYAVIVDATSGTFWVADAGNQRVRVVTGSGLNGIINPFAGGGSGGDGGAATQATLAIPATVAWDSSGTNYYIADTANNRVRKVSGGQISTVAGTGSLGYSGDNGAATSATLNAPSGVIVDASGNVFIADTNNFVIREIAVGTGTITTIAGDGTQCTPNTAPCGDGGPATSAQFTNPTSLAFDGSGNLFIADYHGNRIRKVNLASGIITTEAGTGARGNTGDNADATLATFNHSYGVATDSSGNVYIDDANNNRIRCVLTVSGGCGGSSGSVGWVVNYAFTGKTGYSGEGGLIKKATQTDPLFIASDSNDNFYVSGGAASTVRRIDAATQTLYTIAGDSTHPSRAGFSGDGGPATKASLDNIGVSVNGSKSLLIADTNNNRIRQVNMVPVLTASPTELDFPATVVGHTSSPLAVTFLNTGADDQPLGTFSIGGPNSSDFSIPANLNTCTSSLAPGRKCSVSVTFTPSGTGTRTGYLKNSSFTQRLLLKGTGQ